jgi:hypothetical protein
MWWWGSERFDGGDLELVDGMLWPRRGGAEEGFGCGEVWRCSGLLYIQRGQGGGRPSGVITALVNSHHGVQVLVSRRAGAGRVLLHGLQIFGFQKSKRQAALGFHLEKVAGGERAQQRGLLQGGIRGCGWASARP